MRAILKKTYKRRTINARNKGGVKKSSSEFSVGAELGENRHSANRETETPNKNKGKVSLGGGAGVNVKLTQRVGLLEVPTESQGRDRQEQRQGDKKLFQTDRKGIESNRVRAI